MVSNTKRFGDEAFPKRVAPRALGSKVTMSTLPNSVGSTAVGLDTQRDLEGEEKKSTNSLNKKALCTYQEVRALYIPSIIHHTSSKSILQHSPEINMCLSDWKK